MQQIAIGFAIVSEATGATVGGYILGYLIDRWIDVTKPWITVTMTFLGLIIGFSRMAKRYMKQDKEE